MPRVAACVLLTTLVGCGDGRVRVSGVITQAGQPLTNGSIMFVPADGSATREPAASRIDEYGRYSLSTDPDRRGLVPGEYQIAITSYLLKPGEFADLLTPLAVPDQYTVAPQSGLTATVTSKSRQVIDFDVPARAAGGQ